MLRNNLLLENLPREVLLRKWENTLHSRVQKKKVIQSLSKCWNIPTGQGIESNYSSIKPGHPRYPMVAIYIPSFGVLRLMASRLGWFLEHGPGSLPDPRRTDQVYLLHDCDNPRCIRPSHLRTGNHEENQTDKVRHRLYRAGNG